MFAKRQVACLAALLATTMIFTLAPAQVQAEDCVGEMPDTNCTLDEDTSAPLTIGQNIILEIDPSVIDPDALILGHTIDGKNAIEQGEIATAGNGGVIFQWADIGSIDFLRGLTINNGDLWYVSNNADIILESGADIQLNGGTFAIAPGSGLSMLSAGILGSNNADFLDYVSGGQSYGTTGTIGRAGEEIRLGAGNDRFIYYQSQDSMIMVDRILLQDGDDVMGIMGSGNIFAGDFLPGDEDDTLVFFSGSDAIFGSSASSVFQMGNGNDIIDFDSGTGVANGTISVRTLNLNNGDDIINLVENATIEVTDSFDAGDGIDLITFSSSGYFFTSGDFTMDAGDDILRFNSVSFAAGDRGLHLENGSFTMGAGNDSILFTSHSVGLNSDNVTIDLGAGDDNITFLSNGGTDVITSVNGAGFLSVDGGEGHDAIYFSSNADIQFGSSTGAASIVNVETIDAGDGNLAFVGTIDSNAEIIQFNSAEFSGTGTAIAATLTDDADAAYLGFSSGAVFSGAAIMDDGDDTVAFNSATLSGTISMQDGNDSFSAGQSVIAGTVAGGGDSGDALTFTSGATVVSGDIIGFSSGLLYGSASVQIIGGGTIQTSLRGNTGSVLQFGSAGSSVFTYNLEHTIDGVELEILGDTVDTNGINLGTATPLRGLTVGADALFIIDSNINLGDGAGGADGILDIDGTARFKPSAVITADRYDSTNAGELIFEMERNGGVTSLGTIALEEAGQSIDFSSATGSGDVFRFVLATGSSPLVTDTVSFISAGAGGTVTAPEEENILGDTILYDISLEDTNGNPEDLELAITQLATIEGLTSSDNNETIANVLLVDLLNSDDEGIVALRNAVLDSSGGEEFNQRLEAALPNVDRAAVEGIDMVNRQTFGLINQRLAMLRKDSEGNTGISTGNLAEELEVWWQFYAGSADQDAKGAVKGYESTTYGLATGVDKELFDDGFFGLSFSWGETSSNSKGAGDADTEVDSYQISLYGDYDFGRAYINGMVSYSYNDITTAKTSAAGERTAGYHANYYAARAEAGYTFLTGKTRLIPHLIGRYGYYSPESYIEKGPGAQIITNDSIKIMEAGIGLDMQWLLKQGEQAAYFVPEMRLGYRYDFADEAVISTTQFVAGGPIFEIQGADPSEQAFDLGLGITYFSDEAWEILFNYDMEYREDYLSHAGMVRAAYKFYP